MSRTDTSIFRGGLVNAVNAKSVAGSTNITLTVDEALCRVQRYTGALTGNISVTYPVGTESDGLVWSIENATTGAKTLSVKDSAGNPLQIPQGATLMVKWNGTAMKLAQATNVRRKFCLVEPTNTPTVCLSTGIAAAGATGNVNLCNIDGVPFEYHIKGAGQTLIVPTIATDGLLISLDLTSTEGMELTNGITSRNRFAFTVGTDDAFFFKAKLKIADASGVNPILVGFRKVEAYQATYTGYADYAAIGIIGTSDPNVIKLTTEAAGGGNTDTDTTQTWADAAVKTLGVYVSSAGVVTYTNEGAAPTVTAAFSFTAGDVVMPFLYFLHAATSPGAINLQTWQCGYQAEEV